MKQHFIRFFYLFFVSLLIIGCEAESLYLKDTHYQSNRLSKTRLLKGNEAKDVLNHLNSKLQNSGGFTLSNSDTRFRTNGQSIDYNSILQVIDTLGIKNYTFRIVNHPSDDYKTFHNLVVTEKETELKLSTMKYVMEEQFAIAYNNGIKTFEEFQGKVISSPFSQPLEVANPCVELELEFPPISGGNNPGIGNPGFISPGSISPGGGSSNCSQLNISFECENCSTSYNDWQSFYNSNSCGFGKYDAIVVINYVVANCRLAMEPCNPDGTVGILNPKDDDCNTSKEKLKLVFPNTPDSILEEIATHINDYGKDFGINTKEKLQHFLAQAGHESTSLSGTEFGTFTENLNYRVNKLGTEDYWERYFNPIETPTLNPEKANPNDYISPTNSLFVNKEMFANYVYDDANRSVKGKLGNVNIGDGYKFIGRGIIQLTGRSNYTEFNSFYQEKYDDTVNLLENPELAASDMKIAVISALWYFKNKVLNKLNPPLNNTTTCKKVSYLVNGGTKGLKHRNSLFENAKSHINCL